MKKKKYGEDTCVMRVPVSKKLEVQRFLESFEVIGTLSAGDSIREAYLKGFIACFNEWEKYNQALPYILSGNAASVPLLMDCLDGRLPDSVVSDSLAKLQHILSSSGDVLDRLSVDFPMLESFLEDSTVKAMQCLGVDKQLLPSAELSLSLGGDSDSSNAIKSVDADKPFLRAFGVVPFVKPMLFEFYIVHKKSGLNFAWVRAVSRDVLINFMKDMGWLFSNVFDVVLLHEPVNMEHIDLTPSDFKGVDAYHVFNYGEDVSVSISLPARVLQSVDEKAALSYVDRNTMINRILIKGY